MNDENWYQQNEDAGPPPDPNAPVPQKGMSTGMKVFVGIAIFVGVMAVLCCGGLYYFGQKVANMATNDPAEIQSIREAIAGIELPEGWEPTFGISGGMLGYEMKMAMYERGTGMFALMQLNIPGNGANPQMEQNFRQSLQQQGQSTDIDIESSEERTFTVAGEETTFDFVKGTTQDGAEVRQVAGAFPGRGGPAMLIYQVPEEEWNEEQVVQMIESIQK